MRATEGNRRVPTWRKLAGLITFALLASTLVGPVGVSAKDTRSLYVGDPTQVSSPPDPYEVHPTPVSDGQVTYFDVLIKNLGKQTLTSAVIGMGTLIADDNGFPGPRLPDGWKIKNVTSQAGIVPTCVTDPTSATPTSGLITTGAYDGFSCSFGNLAARSAGGTIRVFLIAGSALPTTNSIVVSGKVAEAVGGNVGSNTNTFYAYSAGSFFVTGDGKIAGLFTNQKITPANHVTGKSVTTVDLTTISGDYVVSIDEVSDGPTCPGAITTCSTAASTVSVNLGKAVSPYFVWTILFPVSSTYKLTKDTGFIHFHDDYVSTDPSTYDVFYNVTQTSCLKPHSKIPCADFSLVTDSSGTFLQIVFETATNSSGKYF